MRLIINVFGDLVSKDNGIHYGFKLVGSNGFGYYDSFYMNIKLFRVYKGSSSRYYI